MRLTQPENKRNLYLRVYKCVSHLPQTALLSCSVSQPDLFMWFLTLYFYVNGQNDLIYINDCRAKISSGGSHLEETPPHRSHY